VSFRSLLRKTLPERLKNRLGRLMVERRERYLGRLPLNQAFDEVYKRGMWNQGESLSGVGSEGFQAERYVALVRDYAARYQLRTVLDGGCGDFSVGSRLASSFDRYTAIDVSPRIIAIDQSRYGGSEWQHVSFSVADLTEAPFPAADLVLIRQVLQHLTNSQIEKVLLNLEASKWRRVLITEDVHDPMHNTTPNLDLPSHSVRTRRFMGSGVFVDRPPFSREANRVAIIYSGEDGRPPSDDAEQRSGGLLVLELSRDAAVPGG